MRTDDLASGAAQGAADGATPEPDAGASPDAPGSHDVGSVPGQDGPNAVDGADAPVPPTGDAADAGPYPDDAPPVDDAPGVDAAPEGGGAMDATPPADVVVSSVWSSADVGAVQTPGAWCSGEVCAPTQPDGTFVLQGSGTDIGGTGDAFRFVYQPMTGDGVFVSRIASIASPPTDASEKAGVMIRDGLAASATNVFLFATPTAVGGYGWTARATAGAGATTTPVTGGGCGAGTLPMWAKVVRSGNDFSGYCSADGVTWTPVASARIAMSATVQVGMALTSHNNAAGVLGGASFDDVSLAAAPPSGPYFGSSLSVGAAQGHWYRVEGENYDQGAEGVAYWDTTGGNAGTTYRTDDVDLEAYCGSGCYDIFQIAPGEWTKYTINATAGTYMLQLGVSSNGVSHMHIDDTNGTDLTGSLTVASTGALSTFQTQSKTVTFALSGGTHTLQVVFDDGSMDLNWIQLQRQ